MTRKLVSLFLSLALLCACIPALAESGLALNDMMDREVSLAGPAEKIVVMMPSDCEILYAIGAGEMIVGAGEYCDYPEEVASVTKVTSGGETNVEQIISLAPDAVVMTKMAHSPELVEQLENAGIAVIVTDAQTIDDTYACIALLGALTGKTAEADALVADMKTRFAAVAEKAADSGLTVYFESTPLEYGWGLWSAAKGSFMDEIGTLCGLKNIFGDVDNAWPMVTEEDVIAANPDIIIAFDSNGMGEQDAGQVISAREGWKEMDAVKNGRVYVLENNAFMRPGPRLVDAAESLIELVESLVQEAPAA